MKKILLEDLTIEEPETIEIECVECENFFNSVDDYNSFGSLQCDECGSTDFYEYTNIENVACDSCGSIFDMWDRYYIDSDSHYICIYCYDDAERLNEEAILIKEKI